MFDGKIHIATGRHRRETNWKNTDMLWTDFVQKLSKTHRTAETVAEYSALKPDRQAEIKDVGGYVGGHITGGRRLSSRILSRSIITLDIDYCDADFWQDFVMLHDVEAVAYSTHKHTSEKPRLRLVVPASREMAVDEYEAVARKFADTMDIELFDPTTFQPERLMYWPSTPRDGQFFFEHQKGEPLDVDAYLAMYRDWRDVADWPVSVRVDKRIRRSALKQGDPLEKPGFVGAFCRTYNIHDAISKYLTEQYEETAIAGRYSYKHGSTSGGLVTYDDKFAFSHHGTDPISGQLCNAFDLVRIHLYGLQDEDTSSSTAPNKRPSYKAMVNRIMSDEDVKRTMVADKLAEVKREFGHVGDEPEDEANPGAAFKSYRGAIEGGGPRWRFKPDNSPAEKDWELKLGIDEKTGKFNSTIENIYLILTNDPNLKGALVYDEFESRLMIVKNLPWRQISGLADWSDEDADCLAHYLEVCYKVPFTHIDKALSKIRFDFNTHPIREYLKTLTWDGVPRVERLFIDYLGASDDYYTRCVARKTLTAAVARVFEPGCKFDYMPVLFGPEGVGKSSLWAKLAGPWFSDCLGDVTDKSGMESLRGVWIMEAGELSSMRRAYQEAVKRFLSGQVDAYRPAYGKNTVRHPRQCIIVGTTNEELFLEAGHIHRRIWPVRTNVNIPPLDIFTDLTPGTVDQIWAEACVMYTEDSELILPFEAEQEARIRRETHTQTDIREGLMERYLEMLLPENWDDMTVYERRDYFKGGHIQAAGTVKRTAVSAAEIWVEVWDGQLRDMNNYNTKPIHDFLKKQTKWVSAQYPLKREPYGRQRCYVRVVGEGAKAVRKTR